MKIGAMVTRSTDVLSAGLKQLMMRELYCDTGSHSGQYWVSLQGYLTAEQLEALKRVTG